MIAEKLRTPSDVAQVMKVSVGGIQVWSASHHSHDGFSGEVHDCAALDRSGSGLSGRRLRVQIGVLDFGLRATTMLKHVPGSDMPVRSFRVWVQRFGRTYRKNSGIDRRWLREHWMKGGVDIGIRRVWLSRGIGIVSNNGS